MCLLRKQLQGKARTVGLSLVIFTSLVWLLFAGYGFLCVDRAVRPGILVVEGWIDEQSLWLAKDIFTANGYSLIITTGIVHSNGYQMGSAGKAVFNVQGLLKDTIPQLGSISLSHSGTSVNKVFPHFRIFIDSVEIAQAYSQKKKADFTCRVQINEPVKTISVLFDNDTYSAWRDRNLHLYALTVNDQVFHPGNCEVTYFVRKGQRYNFKRRFTSDAAHDAFFHLLRTGLHDSAIVPVVTTNTRKCSRTYSTALDVRSYLERFYPEELPPVTVVTRGIHTRRTWVSYRKAFGKKADIGIIALPDDDLTAANWYKSFKGWKQVMYELTGLVYAAVCL